MSTEFSKTPDASSCLLPPMRPVVHISKVNGRSGIGKFITTVNCAGYYSYKSIVAKSLMHDLHLPPSADPEDDSCYPLAAETAVSHGGWI